MARRVLRNSKGNYFELKKSSIGPPDQYLGVYVRKLELTNCIHAWAFRSSRYVTEAIKNVERQLEENGFKRPRKTEPPLQTFALKYILPLNWHALINC